jgi:hypothetical protein
LWPDRAVFHAFRGAEPRTRGVPLQRIWVDVAECGSELDYIVPLKHAVKIGRPCGRCFS